ncbi:hypothetical protein BD413DRAFT_151587 [Trametes elegans]|nr:hypothetical protein BD413DRAFT_151587 [Trametes elegans]
MYAAAQDLSATAADIDLNCPDVSDPGELPQFPGTAAPRFARACIARPPQQQPKRLARSSRPRRIFPHSACRRFHITGGHAISITRGRTQPHSPPVYPHSVPLQAFNRCQNRSLRDRIHRFCSAMSICYQLRGAQCGTPSTPGLHVEGGAPALQRRDTRLRSIARPARLGIIVFSMRRTSRPLGWTPSIGL